MLIGDDRGAHRPADRDADAGRTAAGGVAVVAVDQDDHDREDQHLEERPEHVLRRQEQMEVVVVGAGRLAEVDVAIEPGREVGRQQAR